MNDSNKLSELDPNEPMQSNLTGEIVPDVKSWDKLLSERTELIPCTWQAPFVGVGQQISSGGVSTRNFEVREERIPHPTTVAPETQRRDNYIARNGQLAVQARPFPVAAQGMSIPCMQSVF